MKKRLAYLIGFTLLLIIEILIGAFVHDNFIRPYVGDILVTVLLCCLGRSVFPNRFPWLTPAVFLFAVMVECLQLIDLLGLDGTLLGIILGSTFDWRDIGCYAAGCLLFSAADLLLKGKSS